MIESLKFRVKNPTGCLICGCCESKNEYIEKHIIRAEDLVAFVAGEKEENYFEMDEYEDQVRGEDNHNILSGEDVKNIARKLFEEVKVRT